ncbi:MAG: homoserine dehydrogenase [Ferruginibacter sp.]
MSTQKKITIGLFGFGVVGEGIYQVLLATPSLNASIKKICIKNPAKRRNAPAALFTTNKNDILQDPEINLVVELIDNSEEAFKIVAAALNNKISVVSANKKMIAENLSALLQLQKENNVPFLYEAAVCGSVPIIRNLEEYYDNDLLQSISGIVNGSTNFILTKMLECGLDYTTALQEAQRLGFAESNPALDVSGRDAANKLTILLLHAYGIITKPQSILCKGINAIQALDAAVAKQKNCKIKLVANAVQVENGTAAFVLPQFVPAQSALYQVANEFNGVVIKSKLADEQFLSGKGAGRFPTSSAVLSDIAALRYDYRYEYRRLQRNTVDELTTDFYLWLYVSFPKKFMHIKEDFIKIEDECKKGERHYLIGAIHYETLRHAPWFTHGSVSVIAMPTVIINRAFMNKILVKNEKEMQVA